MYQFEYNMISEGSNGAYLLDVLCGKEDEDWFHWRPNPMYWKCKAEEKLN